MAKIIGIDLGTTNSVAAVAQTGYLHESELLRPASVVVVRPID